MLLDKEFLRSAMKNRLSVDETPGGLMPIRFTAKQLALYSSTEGWRIRSHCPAGSVVDFVSDASVLRVKHEISGRARPWAYFDLYADGALVSSSGGNPASSGVETLQIKGPKLERRLTLHLPQCVEDRIVEVEVDDGAVLKEAPRPRLKLLSLGDSITQGMEALRPSLSYPSLLARALDAELLNQGVGGYFFDERAFDGDMPFSPDIVTVAYGTNDWGRVKTLSELEDNCHRTLSKMVERLAGARIFVISPLWRADLDASKACGGFAEVRESIARCCRSFGSSLSLIDGFELVPQMPEFFGDASLHPNDAGFQLYALGLLSKIVGLSRNGRD